MDGTTATKDQGEKASSQQLARRWLWKLLSFIYLVCPFCRIVRLFQQYQVMIKMIWAKRKLKSAQWKVFVIFKR